MEHILALDVGTSSVKAAVLKRETGEPVAEIARAPVPLESPVADAAEINLDVLWNAVAQAGRAAVAEARKLGVTPEGVGLSTLMPALVLLDGKDQPIGGAWTHLDRRARPEAREVDAELGDEFLQTVGNRPLPGGISALCFRRRLRTKPGLAKIVRSYLHVNGWLGLRLAGAKAFDVGNASFTGLFGTMTDQAWSPRWCEYFQVDPAWLPAVGCGSRTLGSLRAEIARDWNLPGDLPVKLGTADTSSAMLAADMKPGDRMHVVGTTQVLAVVTDQPKPAKCRLTRLLGVGPRFVHVTHNPVGGVALDWIHQLCFADQSADVFFGQTIPQAAKLSTRVQLDPPFLGGDRLEIDVKLAAFRNLDLNVDRMDLLAALLHAMLERHRQAVTDLGVGDTFDRVFLTGGGADVVQTLAPEYQPGGAGPRVIRFEEGSLRGVAKLFQ